MIQTNMNNLNFIDIKNLLNSESIKFDTKIDDSEMFENINSIEQANEFDLIFYNDSRQLNFLKKTKAKACLIKRENIDLLPESCSAIIVDDPYLVFSHISNLFYKPIKSNGIISDQCEISKLAKISKNVQINNFVTIDSNVTIKENVIISENSKIGPNVTIDNNTFIGANSVISNSIIGKNCFLKSNVVLGGIGFGFANNEKITFQHFGKVIIEDNVHIGSNTCIDRANFGSTRIGSGTRLDNLIQIAHNVVIGKNAAIAAQVGIAGSTKIGDNVMIGGQAGISGHLLIGNNVKIAAKSGVTKNIKDDSVIGGFPATDIKKWKLNTIKFNNLK